jgi:hypothetical protein
MAEMKFQFFTARPQDSTVDYYKESLDLPRASIESLNAWLRKNMTLVSSLDYEEMVFQAKAGTLLQGADVYRLLNLVVGTGILVEDDAKLEHAVADLKALGFTAEQIDNFQALMTGVRFPQSKLIRAASYAASAAIPTVQDTRVVCDLRAVFYDETEGPSSLKLTALVPVVIMSLDVDDESGNTRSVVVQFPEIAFSRFRRELSRAAEQLAQLTEIGRKASPQGD